MEKGELFGLTNKSIVKIAEDAAFRMKLHKRFVYGLNNLLIFEKIE